ncbi:DUF7373 family lipoprotein [Nocardia sp. NPDC004278]
MTACGQAVRGSALSGEPDVRKLDAGQYPVRQSRLIDILDQQDYPFLEAVRMSDSVLNPYEVDSKYGQGAIAGPALTAQDMTRYLVPPVEAVLQKYGMVLGFFSSASDKSTPLANARDSSKDREGLFVAVSRFPDEQSAESAATEMNDADFSWNPDNVAVQLPRYSQATAHWRPSVPTLGSTTSHGVFVISILAERRDTNIDALVEMTQKYLDAETKALDGYTPTPRDKFNTLRQDPDRLLVRTLHVDMVVQRPSSGEVVYTRRGFLNKTSRSSYVAFVTNQAGRHQIMTDAQVDRVAVSGLSTVFRTNGVAAARKFVSDYPRIDAEGFRRDYDPPLDVRDSYCYEDLRATSDDRFRCLIAYRSFAIYVQSAQLYDAQQRVVAQYALLANTQ